MAAPTKRRKTALESGNQAQFPIIKYPNNIIFIVERKIQRLRLVHLKNLARRKGFLVSDALNETVTHIVSELETRDQVLEVLKQSLLLIGEVKSSLLLKDAEIVSMGWFSSCMEEGTPVQVKQEHRLKSATKVASSVSRSLEARTSSYQDARYCCQRITPLNHHNKKLTDALEVLEKQADFLGGDNNASRALAFRKASAALKALPRTVRSMREVENLCDLRGGRHCKQVVQEILEEDFCSEVEDILNGEWFKTMKIFTGVFGCGAATARKWFDLNLRHLQDVRNSHNITLTTEQKYGLEFYDDINTPVTRQDAEAIKRMVAAEAEAILPGTTVTITGGFSRGKEAGHDVDLLISHPEEGREKGLLSLILNALQRKRLLEYTDVQNSSYSEAAVRQVRRNQTMDHFERCFSIFRLPKHRREDRPDTKGDGRDSKEDRRDSEEDRRDSKEDNSPRKEEESGGLGEHNPSRSETAKHPSGSDLGRTGEEDAASDRKTLRESRDGLGWNHEEGRTKKESSPKSKTYEEAEDTTESQKEEDQGNVSATDSLDGARRDCLADTADSKRTLRSVSEGGMMVSGDVQRYHPDSEPGGNRGWVARRVDFIIAPESQYAHALLGWIGSRMFNRSMRDYANREMSMTLTSHGLFDKTKNVIVPATSQREIFEHLKLEYREPHERNC